ANVLAILRGDNRIEHLQERVDRFLEMGIVRLVKDAKTGTGTFLPVETREQVIRLAGVRGQFDLSDWGVPDSMVRAFDITTCLGIAAALEALRDAGIPLVQAWRESATGRRVPAGWRLPESMRDTTGIIFASAFPGYTQLIDKLGTGGDDGEGRFDRRFLFQVLSMGHPQLAQLIGARGPNTSVNAACASTTQAVAIGADWIRLGRCERVIVIGADDVTNEQLLPWIGSGFMAAGAATTRDRVEDAALPFDRRRHGMILGMGAVGMVLERADVPAQRGVRPIARLVGDVVRNSAFHGTRLDTQHIRDTVRDFVVGACATEGVSPREVAQSGFFMSHETYTPARGGSAAAEIDALRAAFGDAASDLVIANTKGFTGHPMGAGIEDAVAVKGLQYGVVPPVPNHRDPDPDLGPLRLSTGARADYRYALRLAAGFGSQLAVCLWARDAQGDARLSDPAARAAWLREITGWEHVAEVVEQRTLRATQSSETRLWNPTGPASPAAWLGVPDVHRMPEPAPRRRPAPPARRVPEQAPPSPQRSTPPAGPTLPALMRIVAEKTGYGVDELEPDYELEADLGIDTVKQAEIMAELTDELGLPTDDDFRLADHPTLTALAAYLDTRANDSTPSPTAASVVMEDDGRDAVLDALLDVVARKTGYSPHELEPDYELEADLGIDTVKQAEIMAELTETLGLASDDDFRLADHPTLTALASYLAQRADGMGGVRTPAKPPPTAAPAPTSDRSPVEVAHPTPRPVALHDERTASPVATEPDVLSTLLAVISEKTGYGVEELDLEYELEADLGIDTVKQAEIMSDLTAALGLPQDDDFRLADHPTIGALAGWLAGRAQSMPQQSAPHAPEPADEPEAAPPTAVLVELGPEFGFDLEPDQFEDATAKAVLGVPPIGLPPGFRIRRPMLVDGAQATPRGLSGSVITVLGSDSIATAIRHEIATRGGSTQGPSDTIIDCADDVRTAFHAAQGRDSERPSRWITVTRGGGLGARERTQLADAHREGARAGFTKALGREWPETSVCVVDIDPSITATRIARLVCNELAELGSTEIFHEREARSSVAYELQEPPPVQEIDDGATILITGGGRGISAHVAKAFASRGPTRMVLVGRTGPGDTPLDEATARQQIRERIVASGGRPTPVNIEAALTPLRKADEVRTTIAELCGMGAEVAFEIVDLADPVAVRTLAKRVQSRIGPVNIVVHGAGVEESRKIADKDDAAFSRVFDGKAIGGLALLEALPNAFFVSMGSVAGRFGNAGQVDYAAANDAMARACLTRGDALHIDWTAWDDVGMATRGGMRHLLVERGVDLLPADAGASLLVDLTLSGTTGELVVAGHLPDFDTPSSHPMLDRIQLDGDTVRARRVLSLDSDPWLADHAIDGTPVLPGVAGLEMMAATALQAHPTGRFAGARDVVFHAPVKVFAGNPVTVVIEATREGEDRVRAVLRSERPLKRGRVQERLHFEATILLGAGARIHGLPSTVLPDEVHEATAIYERFFHGPQFQMLTRTLGVAEDALVAEAMVPRQLAPGLVTAPLTLEAAFQAAGLHSMVVEGTSRLPAGFDALHFQAAPRAGSPLAITVRHTPNGYDVDLVSRSATVLRLRGLQFTDPDPLPPSKRFPPPESPRPRGFDTLVVARSTPSDGTEAFLTHDELSELRSRGTERRIADRVAGRIAAKRAVASLTGVDPLHMRIERLASGAPVARVTGHPGVAVSISHSDGHAVAVAARGGRIGVDEERVAPRSRAFASQWLTDGERDLSAGDSDLETLIWATKEAVLKALGTGFALPAHEVQVCAVDGERVRVILHGEAAARHRSLGGAPLQVAWRRVGADVIQVACRLAA
ncbi:MAG: 3-oxoacyl-(acyl-carrier-protein) synthase/NAD(P)-dependent dehydrogenase (short-subunit alcohol dehydrogenase family), partial [Myxococcota bacterium]